MNVIDLDCESFVFSVHHLNPFSRGILFRKNSVNYYNKLI